MNRRQKPLTDYDNGNEANSSHNNLRRDNVGIIRSGSNGRMISEPPQPAPNVNGYRKASNGRFVGFDLVDPGLSRSADGQIQNARNEQQLSRRELRARYGHHNTGERNFEQTPEPPDPAERRQDNTGSVASALTAGFGVSPEVQESDPTRSFQDELIEPGERRTAGGRRGNVPQGFVDNLAAGRDADIAFTGSELERGGTDAFDMSTGGGVLDDTRDGQADLFGNDASETSGGEYLR